MKKVICLLTVLILTVFGGIYFYNYFEYQKTKRQEYSDETMHIVFGIDNNYVEPLNVAITSILWNNRNNRIQFHIISEDLTLNNKNLIKTLVSYFPNATIVFYNVVIPEDFEAIVRREDITKATYFRLYITDLLPEHVDRVLYLDADIIVDDDISTFYKKEFNNKYLIGVKDSVYEDIHIDRLKKYKITQYINAGILLFNAKLLRYENQLNKIVEFIYDNLENKEIIRADQDIINIFWQDKILKVDDRYNTNMRIKIENKPVILHYLGEGKPWDGSKSVSFYDWVQRIPWHVYNGIYQNIINNNSYAKTILYITLRDIYNGSIFELYKIMNVYNQYINYSITSFISKLIY